MKKILPLIEIGMYIKKRKKIVKIIIDLNNLKGCDYP
jgi:hypothetical protein